MIEGVSLMDLALREAEEAAALGEVPVGAVVSLAGEVVARAGNRTRAWADPTAHAEMIAIREAARAVGNERLTACDIHVTLEPCPMCAAAISFARLRRLYFGTADPKGGAVISGVRLFDQPTCHHAPDVYDGIGAEAARRLLVDFFAARR